MKKLFLLMAVAVFAAMTLTSCETDIESSGWLKGTTWKADLAGKSYKENERMGLFPGETPISEGLIKIHFTSNGYTLNIDVRYDIGGAESNLRTRVFPDYEYPTLYFPIEWDEVDKKPVNIVYNVGTISEDLKTIHFDEFRTRGYNWGDYTSYTVYEDVDFIRQ